MFGFWKRGEKSHIWPPSAPLRGVIAQHCNACVLLINHPGLQGEERGAQKKPRSLQAQAAHSGDLLCAGNDGVHRERRPVGRRGEEEEE